MNRIDDAVIMYVIFISIVLWAILVLTSCAAKRPMYIPVAAMNRVEFTKPCTPIGNGLSICDGVKVYHSLVSVKPGAGNIEKSKLKVKPE